MNGTLRERLLRLTPLYIVVVLVGLVFGSNGGTLPKSQTGQDLAIYLAMGVMGLLAWVVQRVVGEQREIALVLNNHLGSIAAEFGKAAERLGRIEAVADQSTQYMATTSAILERIENRVLRSALRPSAKESTAAHKRKSKQ